MVWRGIAFLGAPLDAFHKNFVLITPLCIFETRPC